MTPLKQISLWAMGMVALTAVVLFGIAVVAPKLIAPMFASRVGTTAVLLGIGMWSYLKDRDELSLASMTAALTLTIGAPAFFSFIKLMLKSGLTQRPIFFFWDELVTTIAAFGLLMALLMMSGDRYVREKEIGSHKPVYFRIFAEMAGVLMVGTITIACLS